MQQGVHELMQQCQTALENIRSRNVESVGVDYSQINLTQENVTSVNSASLSNSSPNDKSLEYDALETANFEEPPYESGSGSESEDELSLVSEIKLWALGNNITHKATTELLKILRSRLPNEGLPSDARTLLRTPRQSTVKSVAGQLCLYWYCESFI